VTTNLKTHFKCHVEAKEIKENDFDRLLTWSKAKKNQFLSNPMITFDEITSAVSTGNVNKIVDLFVARGVTVILILMEFNYLNVN
jgi:K+-transporting ATPase A subunit